MALTTAQLDTVVRKVSKAIYKKAGKTANLDSTAIRAAAVQIDADFDVLASDFTQTATIEVNFNARLPNPFKSTATNPEKAILFGEVVRARYLE